jgi:anaerobic ribonucleoside-triphosphate reductase activating protein
LTSHLIKYNVFQIITCSEVEGPNERFSIWFQGCNIKCDGCINKEIQEFKIVNIMTLDEIIEAIKKSQKDYNIEGVTISGGEPTLQNNLDCLLKEIHTLDLGIILYSGIELDKISENIKKNCDIIIDGPFIASKLDTKRRIIGSTNQNINCISNRYLDKLEWYYSKTSDKIEINIGNKIAINGDAI